MTKSLIICWCTLIFLIIKIAGKSGDAYVIKCVIVSTKLALFRIICQIEATGSRLQERRAPAICSSIYLAHAAHALWKSPWAELGQHVLRPLARNGHSAHYNH